MEHNQETDEKIGGFSPDLPVKNPEDQMVLRRAGIKSIETFIRTARLRWYDYETRMQKERLPKFLPNWKSIYGKRSRGRPRKNWRSCVLEDAANFKSF